MITRLCYAIILLLLLTSPIAAQDDTATPFPVLDEAAIFADGVTVIERLPVLNFDNEARELYYFDVDNEQWQIHDYPLDLTTIRGIEQRTDGTYLIFTEDSYTFNADVNPEYVWLFDSDLGLTRPPTTCNLVQALPDEGEWRFTQLDGEESYRFCSTETGEYTAPLPQEIVYQQIPFGTTEIEESIFVCSSGWTIGYQTYTSPNGDWIVFEQCAAAQLPIHTIYSYEIATNTINQLESIGPIDYVLFVDWLDNTTPIFRTGDYRTGASHSFFKVDVTQSDSASQLSIGLYAHIPVVFNNPMRSYSVRGIEPQEGEDFWGGWLVNEHDFESGATQVVAEYHFHGIENFWETGFVLFADDEIIAVQSGYPLDIEFPLYIFDAQTGEFLYENIRTSDVHVAANHTFVFCDWDMEVNDEVLQLIHVTPINGITTSVHYGGGCPPLRQQSVSPSGRYIILVTQGIYSIYDTETRESYGLTQAYYEHTVTVHWHSENTLQITVCDGIPYECERYVPIARWLVQIDALDEEQS